MTVKPSPFLFIHVISSKQKSVIIDFPIYEGPKMRSCRYTSTNENFPRTESPLSITVEIYSFDVEYVFAVGKLSLEYEAANSYVFKISARSE